MSESARPLASQGILDGITRCRIKKLKKNTEKFRVNYFIDKDKNIRIEAVRIEKTYKRKNNA